MAKTFEGKVAWITGGGSGIGRAVAEELAERGAKVAVSGRRLERLEEVVAAIEAAGGEASAIRCDVTREDSVKQAVGEVVLRFGQLDIAMANAGFAIAGKIERLSAEDWRRQLDTNVIGLAITARHALPQLRKTRGRLVLLGSISALLPTPGMGAYSASKHAVRAIGQTLAMELHGSGVSCTTIHPGFVASEIAKVDNEGHFDGDRPDKRPANLMWPSDKAARVMVNAIHRRTREFVFTGHGKVGAFIGMHWPGVAHLVLSRNSAKQRASRPSRD